jgi:adenylate cyclase
MTEPSPFAAVLFIDLAGSALMRKEMAEALKQRGARVLKDESGAIVAIFANDDPSACLQAAIDCQRTARKLGVAAHAGASFGPLKMDEASGGAMLEGACVTLAARLHKLLPGQAGLILLDAATVDHLNMGLRSLCRPVASRAIEGFGDTEVFSLAWAEDKPAAPADEDTRNLEVSVGGIRHVFRPGDSQKDTKVGRSPKLCALVITTDIVSGQHAEFVYDAGRWFLVDASRHGTWMRGSAPGSEIRVHGARVPLGAKGALCLGRPFAQDPQGVTTLEFEQVVGK